MNHISNTNLSDVKFTQIIKEKQVDAKHQKRKNLKNNDISVESGRRNGPHLKEK